VAIEVRYGATLGPVGLKLKAFADRYPHSEELYITSGYRAGPGSHHGGLSYRGYPTAAIDVGAYDKYGIAVGQQKMRAFAEWLYNNYRVDLAELIHTSPDRGWYIQHGVWRDFDAGTKADHVNHVHLAMDEGTLDRLLRNTPVVVAGDMARVDHILETGNRPEPNQTIGGVPINWLVRELAKVQGRLANVSQRADALEVH